MEDRTTTDEAGQVGQDSEEEPKSPQIIKVTEFLEYEFTEGEIRDFAKQLAADTRRIEGLRQQKTSAASQFKASIDEVQARLTATAEHIRSGREFRNLDCQVHFDHPEEGLKTLFRLDTGEAVWTKRLEDYERQETLPLEGSDEEEPEDDKEAEAEDAGLDPKDEVPE